jgi:hypothetical protein
MFKKGVSMTTKQFDEMEFRRGMEVKWHGKPYLVSQVDFEDRWVKILYRKERMDDFGIAAIPSKYIQLDCNDIQETIIF